MSSRRRRPGRRAGRRAPARGRCRHRARAGDRTRRSRVPLQPTLQHHRGGDLVDDPPAGLVGAPPPPRASARAVTVVSRSSYVSTANSSPRQRRELRRPRRGSPAPPGRPCPTSNAAGRRRCGRPRTRGRRRGSPVVAGAIAGALEHVVGRRQRARRVGQREPDTARAEIDTEHPANPVLIQRRRRSSALMASARASSSARSTWSACLPPPTTLSAFLAVPPPSTLAAGAAMRFAAIPRSLRSALTATAIAAFSRSGGTWPTRMTTPEPSASRVALARRPSSSLARSRRVATTPSTAVAASSAASAAGLLGLLGAELLAERLDLVEQLARPARAARPASTWRRPAASRSTHLLVVDARRARRRR